MTFTGDAFLPTVDPFTLTVLLEHGDLHALRVVMHLSLINPPMRVCAACACSIAQFWVRDEPRIALIQAAAAGLFVVISVDKFPPGEHCHRCARLPPLVPIP